MKKLLVLTFLASAMIFGLALPATEAEAACSGCNPGGITPVDWGHGATCQAAITDAINNASALIPGSCEVCRKIPVFQRPCDDTCSRPNKCYNNGQWQVDAKIVYMCEMNLCVP